VELPGPVRQGRRRGPPGGRVPAVVAGEHLRHEFGSLSGAAVESLNRAAALIDCHQNTGEGGISLHHRHGGDLVVQVGTGYVGCREADGPFSLPRLVDEVAGAPVRAIEVKLSQGARP